MSKKAQELAARYGRKSDIVEIYQDILNEQYHVNAFNFPKCPIITNSDEIQVLNWGLVPSWIKTEKDANDIRKLTLNARAETIFEKPSFRESIMKRRCIVPSTGYFEWRHEAGKKTPYYIFLKDEPIFSMAGIYERWVDRSTGEELDTFSIITTDSNPLTGYIHNTKHRMPAILAKADEERWLNPFLPKEDVSNLLMPYEANLMGAYIIQSNFMKKVPADSSIIQRA